MYTDKIDPKEAIAEGKKWMANKNNQKVVVKYSILGLIIISVVVILKWIAFHVFGLGD